MVVIVSDLSLAGLECTVKGEKKATYTSKLMLIISGLSIQQLITGENSVLG